MEGLGFFVRMLLEAVLTTVATVVLAVLFIAGVLIGYTILGVAAAVAFVFIILYGVYHIAKGKLLKWRRDWFF